MAKNEYKGDNGGQIVGEPLAGKVEIGCSGNSAYFLYDGPNGKNLGKPTRGIRFVHSGRSNVNARSPHHSEEATVYTVNETGAIDVAGKEGRLVLIITEQQKSLEELKGELETALGKAEASSADAKILAEDIAVVSGLIAVRDQYELEHRKKPTFHVCD